jgi:hypothetical protein
LKLLKEPLVHFLALGALLFVLYGVIGEDQERPTEIVVTEGKIDNIIELWIRTRQRPPTQQELQGLIDDYVIEEILYREAKALGLDEDDTIIRRRLRQKMEFVADDVAAIAKPTDQDLQEFLDDNPSVFRLDAFITFEQIFFNEDRRGEKALDDAVGARDRLIAGPAGDPRMLGDGIPLPYHLEASSSRDISSMFGPDFANELLTLPVGEWSGPVPSGFGLHVVRVTAMEPGRDPTLGEVRDAVARDWSSERRKQVRDQMYDSFRERYTIIIETPVADSVGTRKP